MSDWSIVTVSTIPDEYTSEASPSLLVNSDRLLALSRVNLKAKAGQLLCIVGQVGSGKSSVLSALLGNMWCCFGTIAVRGKVAYCCQQAFIQNSSLRENIIFGCPYEEERYKDTLSRCALGPDIDSLPGGDETEIGERGINLSGGQKARVSLARAVYADRDIYLLDDPLSAVDVHVGQHLFEQCILPLKTAGKCVILVTNALKFVHLADNIMFLRDGKVAEAGTYSSLMEKGAYFFDMMSTVLEPSCSSKLTPPPSVKKSNGRNSESNESHKMDKNGQLAEKSKDGPKKPLQNSSEKLITKEDQESGQVDMKVYRKWALSAGGLSVALLMVLSFFCGELVSILASSWLSYWSEHR